MTQPDLEFAEAGTGAFVEWECDVYIPEAIVAMSSHGGAAGEVVIILSLGCGWLHDRYTAARAHVLGGQVFSH